MKKVSVIVPVYNVEKYIRECMESIIAQTYTNLEILVNNDGSTDNSYEICKSYAESDKRIKLFSQENQGLSAARNAMLKVFSGDYVMFVDSDDKIVPTCIERLVYALETNNVNAVICNFYRWNGKNINLNHNINKINKHAVLSSKEDIAHFCSYLFGLRCAAWCKLIRREDAQHLVFPVGRYYEDMLSLPEFMSELGNVIYIRDKLYLYRQRKDSILHSSFNIAKTDELDGYIGIVKLGAKLDSMKIAREGMLFFLTMYYLDRIKMHRANIDSSRVKVKYISFIRLFRKNIFARQISNEFLNIMVPPALR